MKHWTHSNAHLIALEPWVTQELGKRKYNFLWCPISQICFPVNLSLFSPPLSIRGLGAFSPAEMPYPLQAPVCENSQLRHRWAEGPPGLATGAPGRSLGFGRATRQDSIIISISANQSADMASPSHFTVALWGTSAPQLSRFFKKQNLDSVCSLQFWLKPFFFLFFLLDAFFLLGCTGV